MDFREKKRQARKSKFEEEEKKQVRKEKRKTKTKKGGSELTTSLLSASHDSGSEPRSFFGDNKESRESVSHQEGYESQSEASVINDAQKAAEAIPEDYAWDFVIVLPVSPVEKEEGEEEEEQSAALEPSEVRGGNGGRRISFAPSPCMHTIAIVIL